MGESGVSGVGGAAVAQQGSAVGHMPPRLHQELRGAGMTAGSWIEPPSPPCLLFLRNWEHAPLRLTPTRPGAANPHGLRKQLVAAAANAADCRSHHARVPVTPEPGAGGVLCPLDPTILHRHQDRQPDHKHISKRLFSLPPALLPLEPSEKIEPTSKSLLVSPGAPQAARTLSSPPPTRVQSPQTPQSKAVCTPIPRHRHPTRHRAVGCGCPENHLRAPTTPRSHTAAGAC